QLTRDGGYIVTGASTDGNANQELLLVEFDALGYLTWAKTYGGISYETGYCVTQTRDGGYLAVGYTASYSPGGYNIFMVRTDSLGTLLWAKSAGGSSTDMCNWVEETSDGGFILTGYTLSYGAGGSDIFIAKTDSAGTAQWAKTYGTSLADGGFCAGQVSGGYVVSGYSQASNTDENALLLMVDSSGNEVWSKVYGGTSNERANSFRGTSD